MSGQARIALILFTVSSVLCAITVFCNVQMHQLFYEKNGYWPDPASGMLQYAETYAIFINQGFSETLSLLFSRVDRSPVSPLLPLLIRPELLASPLAQLCWNIPLLLLFLFLLGKQVYLTSGNLFVAIASIALYATCLVLFAPYFGITFHLPDTATGYLLGISALSFMRWQRTLRLRWVVLISFAVSLAVLLRYASAVYAFLVLAPLFILQFAKTLKNGLDIRRAVIIPAVLMLILVAALCGWYLVKGFHHFFSYYSYWGEAEQGNASVGIARSLITIGKALLGFLGLWHLLLCCIFCGLLVLSGRWTGRTVEVNYPGLWVAFSIPLFLILYYQSDGSRVTSALLACFPLLFAGLCTLFTVQVPLSRATIILCVIFIIACGSSAVRSIHKGNRLVTDDPLKPALRQFASMIAERRNPDAITLLSPQNQGMANALALELFYNYHILVKQQAKNLALFQSRKTEDPSSYLNVSDSLRADYLLLTNLDERMTRIGSINELNGFRNEMRYRGATAVDSAWNNTRSVKAELFDVTVVRRTR